MKLLVGYQEWYQAHKENLLFFKGQPTKLSKPEK